MGDSGAIRAGRAFVEFFAKDKGLAKQLDQYAGKIKSFGGSITSIGKYAAGIGAAVTAPLIAAAKLSADSGAAIYDMSRRTGLSVEALSALGYAADQTGTDLGAVENGVRRMQKSIAGLADESEGTTGKLDLLGISAAELKGLSPEEQFKRISQAVKAIKDPTERAAAVMSVFGKAGTQLIPLIEDFDQLSDRAKELGLIRTTQSATEAKALSTALYDAQRATKSLFGAMASGIIPILREKAAKLMTATLAVRDFVKSHRELVVLVFKAATALGIAGAAVAVLGKAVQLAAPAVSLVGSIFGFLLNPIVLVGAGLVALAGYFLYVSDNGAKALTWLGGKFAILKETAMLAFGGIADALAAGDIMLALQILWAALKLGFIQGTQRLQNIWAFFKAELIKTALSAFYGILSAWTRVSAMFSAGVAATTSTFIEAWHIAVEEVTKLFDGLEQAEREREKKRIQKQLDRKDLAPNVRAQLEGQLANVDKHADGVKAARDQKDAADRRQREQDLQNKLNAIEAEKQQKLKENEDSERAIGAAADANANKEVAELEAQKRELEKQLRELRESAKNKKDNKGKPEDGGPGQSKLIDLDAAAKGAGIRNSSGIFNAAAIQSLQWSPVQDQIAANTKATAEGVKKLVNSRPTFA